MTSETRLVLPSRILRKTLQYKSVLSRTSVGDINIIRIISIIESYIKLLLLMIRYSSIILNGTKRLYCFYTFSNENASALERIKIDILNIK